MVVGIKIRISIRARICVWVRFKFRSVTRLWSLIAVKQCISGMALNQQVPVMAAGNRSDSAAYVPASSALK